MPSEIGAWADRHDTLRTGVAMIPLGLFLGLWLSCGRHPSTHWIYGFLALLATVVVAEAGQLLLSSRVFDVRDILWGGVGSLAGIVLGLAACLRR